MNFLNLEAFFFFLSRTKDQGQGKKKQHNILRKRYFFFLFFDSFGDLNFIFAVLIVSFILPLVRR